jgi:hypothetical protein
MKKPFLRRIYGPGLTNPRDGYWAVPRGPNGIFALLERHQDTPTLSETCVLLELFWFRDLNKGACYPGLRTIAASLGKSHNTIAKHIAALAEKGLIKVMPGDSGFGGASNRYDLSPTIKILEELAPAEQKVPPPSPAVSASASPPPAPRDTESDSDSDTDRDVPTDPTPDSDEPPAWPSWWPEGMK